MDEDMKLLCGDDDDRLWYISRAVQIQSLVKIAIFCAGNFQKARTKSGIQFLAEEAEEMDRKREPRQKLFLHL
jgi:hypothetical protein